MSRLYTAYMRQLDTRPILTKCLTSGTLFGAGDLIAQSISQSNNPSTKRSIDWNRTAKAVFWAGGIFAPLAHVWYNKILEKKIPGGSARAVLTKVFLDQTVWALGVNCAYLTYATVIINNKDFNDAKNVVTNDIWGLMKANWVLWPAVQLVNFKFVPGPLQVPFINVVVLGWSVFLATFSSNQTTEQSNNQVTLDTEVDHSNKQLKKQALITQ